MVVEYASPPIDIVYPDSDGQPMAESDFQRIPLTYAVEALGRFFADRPDVYVSGNTFVYYEAGKPSSVVAPDVLVALGIDKHQRRSYKVWEEGKAPDFVLEITSDATRIQDQGPKRGLYAYLGVTEYCQLDPTGDYLKPSLQGFRLRGDTYRPLVLRTEADGTLVLPSQTLGLELRFHPATKTFRFFDPATARVLPSYAEAEAQRRAAEERAEQEARAREAAEGELARLRAELARLRGETP